MSTASCLKDAYRLSKLGYRLFRLAPQSKVPLAGSEGCKEATCDDGQIADWWEERPDANLGLSTDGSVVIDCDPVDDQTNPWLIENLERLTESCGASAETPRGGRHFYYRAPEGSDFRNSSGRIAPGIDVRANGGYVVLPPSWVIDPKKRINGGYRWVQELNRPPEDLPEPPPWLLELLVEKPAAAAPSVNENAEVIPEGQRNDSLARFAGALRGVGMDEEEIRVSLRSTNAKRCRPPLDDDEVDRIAHSICRYRPSETAVRSTTGHRTPKNAIPDEPVPDWQPFPIAQLPEPLRSYAKTAAKAIGCDIAMVAGPLLVMCAIAIGNSRRIILKNGWDEPAIIWLGVVSESGTHKSPALDCGFRALKALQRVRLKEYAAALADYEQRYAEWKGRHTKNPSELPPVEPVAERYLCDDATIEALVWLLKDQPRGLGLVVDELAGWLGGIGKYSATKSQAGDAARWLEMYHGRMVMLDRKTGIPRTIAIPHAAVSVCGGIQPAILERVLTEDFRLNGLAARLLLMSPPRRPRQWIDAEIPPDAEATMRELIDRLLALSMTPDDDGGAEPVHLRLSPHAQELFIAYVNDLGAEQLDLSGELSATWSKLEAYAARFALILACIKSVAHGEDGTADVDADSMAAGIALARWFAGEAKRVHALHHESVDARKQRELIEWIRRKGGSTSVREVLSGYRRYRGRTAEEVREALDAIRKAGKGRWVTEPTSTKSGERFVLNDDCQQIPNNALHETESADADMSMDCKSTLHPGDSLKKTSSASIRHSSDGALMD
ncbi:MAG: DUF3987 domain-containing protein [Planctomycetaceae bacterium]|nr:DUF3987 domain-containing protein [Planctomycetaceae bacterium]